MPEKASASNGLLCQQKQTLLLGTEASAIMSVAETPLSCSFCFTWQGGAWAQGPARWGKKLCFSCSAYGADSTIAGARKKEERAVKESEDVAHPWGS